MRKRRSRSSSIVAAALCGFLAGAIAVSVVAWGFSNVRASNRTGQGSAERTAPDDRLGLSNVRDAGGRGGFESRPSALASPPPVAKPPPIPSSDTTPVVEEDPLRELRNRELDLPVRGMARRDLRDSFNETRGSTHKHEAIDILAPRNTPVLAVEDGIVARLFESKAGGTTVYQFDPTTRYVYYYAHLERYADGLQEGNHVQRGQVLGYVGTSGNAPKETPHLHFAVFRLTEKKQWWQGSPIDPYEVLK
jgi:murein DD-endopeptidase MepM/ murein hydrolase activator NlpD